MNDTMQKVEQDAKAAEAEAQKAAAAVSSAAAKARVDYQQADTWLHAHSLTAVRILIAILAVVALSLFAVHKCHAATTAQLTYTAPTTNTDSSAIPATGPGSISSYAIQWGSCSGSSIGTVAGTATATALTYTVTGLTPGTTYCFQVAAVNTYGAQSAWSNAVNATITTPIPNPPVLSSTVKQAWNLYHGKPFLVVGTAPIGTPCGMLIATVAGQKYYQLPQNAVKFTNGFRPQPVVTRCAVG